jgi:hypothetical protein
MERKRNSQRKPPQVKQHCCTIRLARKGLLPTIKAWLRGWREHKITEFDVFFQEGLRELKRKEYNMEDKLRDLEYQPLLTISKEFWVPSVDQLMQLEAEANDVKRGYMERRMMAQWA